MQAGASACVLAHAQLPLLRSNLDHTLVPGTCIGYVIISTVLYIGYIKGNKCPVLLVSNIIPLFDVKLY